jgi:hypothetical protein
LSGDEIALNQNSAQMDERTVNLLIENKNLRRHAAKLEDLRKQFPQSVNIGVQAIEHKNRDVKYLPLATQIVAVNAELAESDERLLMLQSEQEELVLLSQFFNRANELTKNDVDGLVLIKKLLALQEEIKQSIANPSLYQRRMLGQIKLDLLTIDTRYGVSLAAYQQRAPFRSGMWKFGFGGLGLGVILSVLLLLAQGIWRRHLASHPTVT